MKYVATDSVSKTTIPWLGQIWVFTPRDWDRAPHGSSLETTLPGGQRAPMAARILARTPEPWLRPRPEDPREGGCVSGAGNLPVSNANHALPASHDNPLALQAVRGCKSSYQVGSWSKPYSVPCILGNVVIRLGSRELSRRSMQGNCTWWFACFSTPRTLHAGFVTANNEKKHLEIQYPLVTEAKADLSDIIRRRG